MLRKFFDFFHIKDELKKQVNKLDKFVKEYSSISQNIEIPSVAYVNWGIQLAEKGCINEAVEKLRTATLMAGNNPNAFITLGITQLRNKEYEEAIKNFRTAARMDKFNAKAYAMWGSALSEIGDLKGAIEIYKLAEKYDSRDPEVYLNWGISLARSEKKKEAEEKFKKAAYLNPLNPITPFLWGILLMEQGKYTEAIAKFNHTLTYTKEPFDTLHYIAFCYIKINEYTMAINYAKEAIGVKEDRIEPYLILAEAYTNIGQDNLCLETFETAEKKAQTTPQFYTNWGIVLQKNNQLEKAREMLYNALMITPNNELVLFNIGVNFLMGQEYTQAEEFFDKVLDINPKHMQALFNKASINYNKGDYDKAIYLYEQAFSSDKKNNSIYFNLANCYHKKNNTEKAKQLYLKCIEYCPDFTQAYVNLANLLVEMGEIREAIRKIRSAYLKNKEDCYIIFSYGVILLKLEEYKEAAERFEQALSLNSQYEIARLGLAESLFYLNDYEAGLNILNQVSEDFKEKKEYIFLFEKFLNNIIDNNCSRNVIQNAYEGCNNFLERYNNDKIVEYKKILLEKLHE